jgi:hypothetical protein
VGLFRPDEAIIMTRVTLDPELRAKLNGLSEQVAICDEAGKTVGLYLPVEAYKKLLYQGVEIPFTEEEIERFRNEPGGISLQEFWKRMGRT